MLKHQCFGYLMWRADYVGKDTDAGKDWGQEKWATEDEMVGWHHWLKGHEFEQAPGGGEYQGSLVFCSPWGPKELDTTEWTTELRGKAGRQARKRALTRNRTLQNLHLDFQPPELWENKFLLFTLLSAGGTSQCWTFLSSQKQSHHVSHSGYSINICWQGMSKNPSGREHSANCEALCARSLLWSSGLSPWSEALFDEFPHCSPNLKSHSFLQQSLCWPIVSDSLWPSLTHPWV